MPGEWSAFVSQCRSIEAAKPDPADEIMLYQMIVGAWPTGLLPSDEAGCRSFAERLAAWQQKALREAKLHTDWTAPNQHYETVARDFLFSLFSPQGQFLPLAQSFVDMIAPAGAVNGLAQMVLKMTVPGMPDFFQGTEFWDFSLVDPDNRRPVDYIARQQALAADNDPRDCQATWRDGRVKQSVMRKVLDLRHRAPRLFSRGSYSPLPVKGALEDDIVAFTREFEGSAFIVVVPRLASRLLQGDDSIAIKPQHLHGSTLSLPEQLHGIHFKSLFTGDRQLTAEPELPLAALLRDFPIELLHSD
jgi:(1->4)-alpha-D-glucan 1-alpha-D-glucosylmutase